MPRRRKRPEGRWVWHPHSRTLDARIKWFLGEMSYRLLKIGGIALAGGVTNLLVHQFTDNHALNATAMILATGAAAAVKTGK